MPAEIKTATKAIDKLRIQGNAAPRRGPELRAFHCVALNEDDAPSRIVYQADTGSTVNGSDITTIINSHPSSAASRKHDHLQRVQQANRGLTSAEFGATGRGEGLPSIHFLLRGKPAHAGRESAPFEVLNHQRVGHYKTSAKEVYRARHRINNNEQLSSSGDQSNFFRAIRTPYHDVETLSASTHINSNNSNNAAVPVNHFYLGPTAASSGQGHNPQWLGRRGDLELTSAPAGMKRPHQIDSYFPTSQNDHQHHHHQQHHHNNNNNECQTWSGNNDNSIGDTDRDLTCDGHQHITNTPHSSPRGDDPGSIGDSQFLSRFHGQNALPETMASNPAHAHSRQRHTSTWSRRGTRDPQKFKYDHSSLKDCLHVHQSYKIPYKTDISPRDIFRLRHCPQTKVNYNNPYRNLRSKDRKGMSSAGRYIFNSVESYIHFNKIYPRASDMKIHSDIGSSSKGTPSSGLPNIPRVNGFTSHCTDTVLLKMMFEMNKPKSGKSISKYSDVAVHRDLDEFMIVSTPTVSRSPSVVSRKTPGGHSKARSQVGFNSTTRYKEEDEERTDVHERKEDTKEDGEEDREEHYNDLYENEGQPEVAQDVEADEAEDKEENNAGDEAEEVLDPNQEDGAATTMDDEKNACVNPASPAADDTAMPEEVPDVNQHGQKRPASGVSESPSVREPDGDNNDDA